MANIKVKPPWEMTRSERQVYERSGHEKQQAIMDEVMRRKKVHASSGKWRNWEEGRKQALRERRDYFRNNPDKKDDFSGV